jgi:hypothetical protein
MLAGLMAFAVLLAGKPQPTSALPTTLLINGVAANATVAVPLSALVAAGYNDEGAAPQAFVLSSSVPAVGYFYGFSLTANSEGQVITPTPAVNPTSLSVADDGDGTVDATAMQAFFLCVTAGVTTISSTQGGGTIATPLTITCTGGSTLTTTTATPTIGVAFTVNGTCGAAGQALTSSPAANGAFSAPITNGTLVPPSTVNCTAAGAIAAQYICTVAGVVTFTLNAVVATVTCGGAGAGGLTVTAITAMSGTVTGQCPAAGSVLTQTGPAAFTNATLNGTVIPVTAGSISCTAAGTLIASFTCNTTGNILFALGAASANFACGSAIYNNFCTTAYAYNCGNYCGAYGTVTSYACNPNCLQFSYQPTYGCNNGYQQQYPYQQQQYPQPLAVVPSSLTITSTPSVACGQTAQVTIRVVGANGAVVPDGTQVSLTASTGTVNAATNTTTAGALTATYTAPANVPATSVTLRATAGSATNTAPIAITCTQTATAPVTTAPPVTVPVAIPSTIPIIAPPNTGDGGLLATRQDEPCLD